jgi:hypothetical protein
VPAAGLAALLAGHPRGPPCPVGRAPEAHPTDPGRGAPAFLGGCPSRLPGLAAGRGPRRSQKPRGAPPRGLVRTAVLCGPAPPLGRSRARRKTAGGSRARRWAGPWPSAARRAPPRRLSPAPSSRVPASSCRGRPPPPPPRAGLPTVPRPMAGRCFPRPPGREPCPLQSEMAPADLSEL